MRSAERTLFHAIPDMVLNYLLPNAILASPQHSVYFCKTSYVNLNKDIVPTPGGDFLSKMTFC